MGESVLHLASRRTASIRAKQGDDMIEIGLPVASSGLSESKPGSDRKKVLADRIIRPVPRKPNRVIHSCKKMKKTTVSSPPATVDAQRRNQPAIYYTEDPKVLLTDPSEFMWLVQRLTGSRCTRSRCKKNRPQRSGDAMSNAQLETGRADVSKPAGSIANSTALKGPESRSSKGSNDEEESVSTDFMNSSSESVSGFPTSPTTKSVKLEITDAEDESPRGPLPLFDWFCSGFVTDDRNLAPSLFDSCCPGTLELPEHFTPPVSEPIPDSFMFPLLSFRDVDSSTLLDDVPWLLSS